MDDAVEALIKELLEGTAREKAAEALGVIGDAHAVEPLSQALQDENTWFQEVVVRALGKIGKPALKPLMEIVDSPWGWDPYVRAAAVEAVGEIGDVKVIYPFLTALGDIDSLIRSKAAKALVKIDDLIR